MRKYIFISTFILFTISSYGQEGIDLTKYQDTVFIKHNKDWTSDKIHYVTDTVIFQTGMRRNILTGTTILPVASNTWASSEYGLFFYKVTKTDCQKDINEYDGSIKNHINSVLMTDSSLIVDFNIYDNCCYDFLCNISVDSTGVLDLIYTGYGTYCSCDCCFGLTYYFRVKKGKDILVIKSVMLNGNRDSMKPIKTK